MEEGLWYRGTADAVAQNKGILRSYEPEYILVLAGDHIYKMDYSMLLLDHVESKSLCTVACIEVPREDASGFGVMDVDENRKITRFLEKPADPPGMPDNPDKSLASMGIYVFNADYLYRLLDEDCGDNTSSHDFGKTSFLRSSDRAMQWHTISPCPAFLRHSSFLPIGAMWEQSILSGQPIWT